MQIDEQDQTLKKHYFKLTYLFAKPQHFNFTLEIVENVQALDSFNIFIQDLLANFRNYKMGIERVDYFLFRYLKFLAFEQKKNFFLNIEQAEIYK